VNISNALKAKTAANREENAMRLVKDAAANIIEDALYAANLTADRVRALDSQNKQADGEELPIPEEDANAMLSQSLESQGVDPGVLEGLPVEGEIPQEGAGIDPAQTEQLESLIQELNANGVSDEEIEQAVAELVDEGALDGEAGGEAAVDPALDPAALGAEGVDPAALGAEGIDPNQAAELESAIQELSAQGVSDEEIEQAVAELVEEGALGGDPAGEEGFDPAALGAEAGIDPDQIPELEGLVQELEAQGVSDEEIMQAVAEIAEEEEAGIDPAAAAVADAEVEKTGQYKSASFSANGTVKSAEQEKRSACVRGAMRDFLYLRNGTYNPASLTPSVWS
jgi:DNA-binding transcriptional regulator YhcF (GntR family)